MAGYDSQGKFIEAKTLVAGEKNDFLFENFKGSSIKVFWMDNKLQPLSTQIDKNIE